MKKFPAIGEVVTKHTDSKFFDYNNLSKKINPRPELYEDVQGLVSSNCDSELALNLDDLRKLTREGLEILEKKGIITVKYNKDYPLGSYALNDTDYNSPFLKSVDTTPKVNEKVNSEAVFVLKNYFRERFSLATRPSVPMTKEAINNAAFENISTTAQVLAICTKNDNGQWEWGQSQIYPDGFHVQPPLTATEQYAQSCFEGLVAMVNSEGEITIFRPEENAKRLNRSCEALAIPPLDETQVLDSIKYAVLANKEYLPVPGSNAKMYIRPYVKGLEGGYGVGPANSYLFAVEVFPFGDYVAKRDSVINIVGIPGKRRSHEGNFGMVKGSGNYGQTLLDREKAKKGVTEIHGDKKFHDTFYLGLKREKINISGEEVDTLKEVLDEDSAGNLFFITENDNKICIHTPPLDRGAILPGITRDSVLKIAQELGYDIKENELTIEDIKKMKGAFLSGSAAGIVRIGSMSYLDQNIHFDTAQENTNDISKAFFAIYDVLYAARKGELKPSVSDKLRSWAKVIGKIELE